MVDLKPLGTLIAWGLAALIAIVVLSIASVFAPVPMWAAIPATIVAWAVLRLTILKE